MAEAARRGLVNVPGGASSVQLLVKGFDWRHGAHPAARQVTGPAGLQLGRGPTDSGAAAAAGTYNIQVVARVGDQNTSLATSVAARVSSVALDPSNGGLVLDTEPLGDVAMSAVERVL